MKHPEVRPLGDDPADWEGDLPEPDARPGERWLIEFSPDDPKDAPAKWVKDFAADDGVEEEDDDDSVAYGITGNFNSWQPQTMDSGSVAGQHVATVSVPNSGSLEFHFLREPAHEGGGLPLCPATAKCTRKTMSIQGPAKGLTNAWAITAAPGTEYRIELMVVNKKFSVVWFKS